MVAAGAMNLDRSEKGRGPRTELCGTQTFENVVGGEQRILKRRSWRGRKGRQRGASQKPMGTSVTQHRAANQTRPALRSVDFANDFS